MSSDPESRIRGIIASIREFVPHAQRIGGRAQREAEQRRATEHAKAAKQNNVDAQNVDHALARARRAARTIARQRAVSLAPGPASAQFSETEWLAPGFLGRQPPKAVRIGRSGAGFDQVPIVVPLLPTPGWYVEADTRTAIDLVHNVVLRVVAATPPNRIRVDSYDPKLTGAIGVFGALRERAAGVMPRSATSIGELDECLDGLVETLSSRAAKLVQLGYGTFEELLANSDRILEPYRLVVVLDYPAGIDERRHKALLRVVESAASRGVSFLIHRNPDVDPEQDIVPDELRAHLRRLTAHGSGWDIEGLAGTCERDPPPETALCSAVGAAIGESAAKAALPVVEFAEVLPPRTQWWQPAVDELRVTIGFDERSPAEVRLRSSNPPLPNVLVGGAVGQGKSNLLLVLVHGLAARYAPADLEMYLLDFKQGLEFSVLGPAPGRKHWLPHVRVLGVHSDREFGIAVLRHVAAELEGRGERFKRLGVADIALLPPGKQRPPRILLVLDEFQVLLAEDDMLADEATNLLERLVRLGRAYGVHVVLATQTLEGIQRLAVKRESIFGQVPYRMVLKTTATDSQAMLQVHNTAGALLRFRGEAILNDNFGALDGNRNVLVAFADKQVLDGLRRELWQRAANPVPPRIFEQGQPADLARALATSPAAGNTEDADIAQVWLGMPITVDERPAGFELRPEPGAGLLVLGDDAETAFGMLCGVTLSVARSWGSRGDRVVLLDMMPADPSLARPREALFAALAEVGCDVEVVPREDVPRRLYALREEMESRSGTEPGLHLVGWGFHRAARLTVAIPDEDRFEPPTAALQEIARHGPAVRMFLYGWWNRMSVCTNHLGFNRCDVNAHMFLRHPIDAVRDVCGPLVTWSAMPHRGLFWDGMSDEPLQVVTFAPLSTGGGRG